MNISEIQRVNDAINFYTEKSEEYKNKARIIAKGCIGSIVGILFQTQKQKI